VLIEAKYTALLTAWQAAAYFSLKHIAALHADYLNAGHEYAVALWANAAYSRQMGAAAAYSRQMGSRHSIQSLRSFCLDFLLCSRPLPLRFGVKGGSQNLLNCKESAYRGFMIDFYGQLVMSLTTGHGNYFLIIEFNIICLYKLALTLHEFDLTYFDSYFD
jgi:hypothetical protein